MPPSQPKSVPTLPSDILPLCADCGTLLTLAGIEASKPGYEYEYHTFECLTCAHSETFAVKC